MGESIMYNILNWTESFFAKICLHIIQCYACIQEAVKIISQETFYKYIKELQIKRRGGTGFRPGFSCVNKLISQQEVFIQTRLVYLTDGYGSFPRLRRSRKLRSCLCARGLISHPTTVNYKTCT